MDEAEARESAAMIESAKAQYEALMRQQEIIRLTVDEHSRARDTISMVASGKPGDDILVPIGAESFIHARISEEKSAIVGVGADVSFQRPPEEAQKLLGARIDELNRAAHKIGERIEQTELTVQQLSEKLQEHYSRSEPQ
ncbi:MAG TPA: prefoldin subunit alpha [Thermoplasmata archaeon]|nr:prefoldin subunit alpha [Thermoplasmata archaeon]